MRILALMSDAYSGHGGIAQYNRDLLGALSEMPEVVAVASVPRLGPSGTYATPQKLVEHVGTGGIARYVWRAMMVALSQRPQLILCGHINLLPVAALIKRVLRVPLAIELYGVEAWSAQGVEAWPADKFRWCLSDIDLAISISRFTRRMFIKWTAISPEKVRVVPNAIHLDQYAPMPAATARELQERHGLKGWKILLTVGRLLNSERYKGHDRIIRLMPKLLDRHPDLMYVIAGDGDDRRRLERLAIEFEVADRVRFIGRVPAGEMSGLYNLADAFAMPSTGEGFGFVFLEAAACGLPVLGGNIDGSPDALADGRIGIMVNPDDEKDLYDGLLHLLDRHKAVPHALAPYDYAHFRRQVRELVLSTFINGCPSASPRGALT